MSDPPLVCWWSVSGPCGWPSLLGWQDLGDEQPKMGAPASSVLPAAIPSKQPEPFVVPTSPFPSPFSPLHRTHHRHNDVRRRPHLNGPAERESRSCLVWSPLHSRRNNQVSWVSSLSLYLFSALIPPGPWALGHSQRHSLVPCAHTRTAEHQLPASTTHSLSLYLCVTHPVYDSFQHQLCLSPRHLLSIISTVATTCDRASPGFQPS